MVKKWFRNSVAGACMAMSFAIGSAGLIPAVSMASENLEDSESSEEDEEREDGEDEAFEASVSIRNEGGSEFSYGDSVRQKVEASYENSDDAEIIYSIDSKAEALTIETDASGAFDGGSVTVTYEEGTADVTLSAKTDLSGYAGITKLAVHPAKDGKSGGGSFTVSFIVCAESGTASNSVELDGLRDSCEFTIIESESDGEAETLADIAEDGANIGGEIVTLSEDEGDAASESEGGSVQTLDDENPDKNTDGNDTDSGNPNDTNDADDEDDPAQKALQNTLYVSMESAPSNSANPSKGETVIHNVNVKYNPSEGYDTTIEYTSSAALPISSVTINSESLNGSTIVAETADGEEETHENIMGTVKFNASDIVKITITPINYDAEEADASFSVTLTVASYEDSIDCTAEITTKYENMSAYMSEKLTVRPFYAIITTPTIRTDADEVAIGDSVTVTIDNIDAEIYADEATVRMDISVPDYAEVTNLKLPTFSNGGDISVYTSKSKNSNYSLIGTYGQGETVSLNKTGISYVRLELTCQRGTILTTDAGKLIVANTQGGPSVDTIHTFSGEFSIISHDSDSHVMSLSTSSESSTFKAAVSDSGSSDDDDEKSLGNSGSGSDSSSSSGSDGGNVTTPNTVGGNGTAATASLSDGSSADDSNSSDESTTASDIKQQILDSALEDGDDSDDDSDSLLTDRINAIIASATDEDEDDDSDGSSDAASAGKLSLSDPERYADWKVRPIFENLVANIVETAIQPIDEGLVGNVVPEDVDFF